MSEYWGLSQKEVFLTLEPVFWGPKTESKMEVFRVCCHFEVSTRLGRDRSKLHGHRLWSKMIDFRGFDL